MGEHLIDGDFQSDKYPSCPRGKVPLSTGDKDAQDLLWIYAQRHHGRDVSFSDDLTQALLNKGFEGASSSYEALVQAAVDALKRAEAALDDVTGWSGGGGNWPAQEALIRIRVALAAFRSDKP